MAINIRTAADKDVPAIAGIYAHYVTTALATFEIDPPSAEEIARRRAAILARDLPYLVADLDGQAVGYAYVSPYHSRMAYRFSVEDSIYVHPEHARKGIGRQLLAELIDRAEKCGCRQMVAIIGDSDNAASIGLHAEFGFRHVGVLRSVGFKFDRWVDTVLMQRELAGPAQ
jgi:L-amino acid N-acyltransferase YncA